MDANDRQAIEELFEKLRAVERRLPQRDREAEAMIGDQIGRQPAAPYYMAQTIIVQEQALEAAQRRIDELDQRGGRVAPWSGRGAQRTQPDYRPGYGGGFLAGAFQTALGVAGGVVLANLITGAFTGNDAEAAEATEAEGDAGDDGGGDAGGFDGGGDFGGDF